MMKNLFEQSRSHWVRYDHYEMKTAGDGKRYITPGKNAKPDVYNPLKEAPDIVLDALNVGDAADGGASRKQKWKRQYWNLSPGTACWG